MHTLTPTQHRCVIAIVIRLCTRSKLKVRDMNTLDTPRLWGRVIIRLPSEILMLRPYWLHNTAQLDKPAGTVKEGNKRINLWWKNYAIYFTLCQLLTNLMLILFHTYSDKCTCSMYPCSLQSEGNLETVCFINDLLNFFLNSRPKIFRFQHQS